MGLHPHFPVEHMDQVIFVQVGILGQVVQRNRLGKMLINVQPHTGTFPGAFAGAGGGMAVLTQAGNAQHNQLCKVLAYLVKIHRLLIDFQQQILEIAAQAQGFGDGSRGQMHIAAFRGSKKVRAAQIQGDGRKNPLAGS